MNIAKRLFKKLSTTDQETSTARKLYKKLKSKKIKFELTDMTDQGYFHCNQMDFHDVEVNQWFSPTKEYTINEIESTLIDVKCLGFTFHFCSKTGNEILYLQPENIEKDKRHQTNIFLEDQANIVN